MTQNSINWIIFDLGGVLVNLKREAAIYKLQELTECTEEIARAILTEKTAADLGEKRLIEKFTLGEISADVYLDAFLKMVDNKITKRQAELVINSILAGENKPVVEILAKLSKKYNVACYSNTHQLHWDYLQKHYSFFKYFKFAMASHLAGLLKPNPAVYSYIQEVVGAKAQECLLIDDMLPNVTGAHHCHWKAINFINPNQLVKELAKFNILP